MAKTEPVLIICKEPKIHKPKPKRVNKKTNIFQYNKSNINNRQSNKKTNKINNQENRRGKNYFGEDKRKQYSFNLDLISFEEIENDFKIFKSKSEEIEEQRELINLLKKSCDESCRNDNFQKIRRPKKPSCINIDY